MAELRFQYDRRTGNLMFQMMQIARVLRERTFPPHVILAFLIDNHKLAALLVQALALKNLRMNVRMTDLLTAGAGVHT